MTDYGLGITAEVVADRGLLLALAGEVSSLQPLGTEELRRQVIHELVAGRRLAHRAPWSD